MNNDVLNYVARQPELLHLPNIDDTKSNPTYQSIDNIVSTKVSDADPKWALIYQPVQNKPGANQAWAALQKTAHR